jgi:dolichol-phosphate mannosyltransferase
MASFMSDPKTPSSDQVGAFWDAQARSIGATGDLSQLGTVTRERTVVAHRDRLERAHLEKLLELDKGSRVLDLGGGAGRIALWLAPRVAEVTLVDVSRELLSIAEQKARELGVSNLKTAYSSLLQFESEGTFDAILIMDVCTHLNDGEVADVSTLCARLLAPGGKLYLKEPVTTDHQRRIDERSDVGVPYRTTFRPREQYPELFAAHFRCTYQRATLAHFIPWFLGGTDGAVAATSGSVVSKAVELLSPTLVKVDPLLQILEDRVRGQPRLAPALATVSVLHDFYVLEPLRQKTSTAMNQASPSAQQSPALSVVVIAYNEQECIADVLSELRAALDEEGVAHELVLVDDGSSDGTLQRMSAFASKDRRAKVVPLKPNRGIGGALRAGFDAASGEHVTWIPADGQIGPEVVLELFKRRRNAPMTTTVYAKRNDAWYRHVISGTLNELIKLQTGQVAKSGGTYVFSREVWQRCAPRDDDTMMISTAFRHNLREAGERIDEIDIEARARVAGHSKVLNPKTIARTLSGLIKMKR